MRRSMLATGAFLASALLSVGAAWGQGKAKGTSILSTPPANFKKVSTLVKLPDFVPGLGTLYVDPATIPVGPFLGYNKAGKLVDIVYMLPLKQLDDHKNFDDEGGVAKGLRIDHVDVDFNPGHPGVEEPHYHVTEWRISHAQEQKTMK